MTKKDLEDYIEQTGSVNFVDSDGDTALKKNAKEGDAKGVKFLLSKGADVHAVDDMNQNILSWAIYSGDYNTVEGILKAGADINAISTQGVTAMHMSLYNKVSDKIFRLLLSYEPDLSIKAYREGTVIDLIDKKYKNYKVVMDKYYSAQKKLGKYADLLGDI